MARIEGDAIFLQQNFTAPRVHQGEKIAQGLGRIEGHTPGQLRPAAPRLEPDQFACRRLAQDRDARGSPRQFLRSGGPNIRAGLSGGETEVVAVDGPNLSIEGLVDRDIRFVDGKTEQALAIAHPGGTEAPLFLHDFEIAEVAT